MLISTIKKILIILSFLLIISLTNICYAKIQSPQAEFYVNDFANIIDLQDKKTILNNAKKLYENTGNSTQVVVVTVDSLDGLSIEDYANRLFNIWGIGSKNKNDGVLILIAPNERQSRIEVGYGLEGILPDGKTGRIQDNYMLPYFRNNNYSKGILEGFNVIVKAIETGDNSVIIEDKINMADVLFSVLPTIIFILVIVIIVNIKIKPKKCPKCKNILKYETKVIRPATYISCGLSEHYYICTSCKFKKRKKRFYTPKLGSSSGGIGGDSSGGWLSGRW